jgi:hypothetical protein
VIAAWEISSRRAYSFADGCGAKYFARLGSFQTCHDWIGSGLAAAPYFWW